MLAVQLREQLAAVLEEHLCLSRDCVSFKACQVNGNAVTSNTAKQTDISSVQLGVRMQHPNLHIPTALTSKQQNQYIGATITVGQLAHLAAHLMPITREPMQSAFDTW